MNLLTTVVLAITVLATTGSVNKNFVYNSEMKENVVKIQTVYRLDETGKYLTPHLKYEFDYDELKQLTEKNILKWDATTQTWENCYKLSLVYDVDSYELAYQKWDSEKNQYVKASEKVIYTFDELNKPNGYHSYKIDAQTGEWYEALNHQVEIPEKYNELFALGK